jgi:flagellar protein FliS
MNPNPSPGLAYRQMAVSSANAIDLVVLLYDAALASLHKAIRATEAGQVEQRVEALNHMLEVITHLQQTLDFTKGEEAAHHLDRFYHHMRARILDATITQSAESLRAVAGEWAATREAWAQAGKQKECPPSGTVPIYGAVPLHWSA